MLFKKNAQPAIRSLIGEGTRFEGDITFRDGLRIDGEVIGNIAAMGDGPTLLVICEKARVRGRVKAGHVIINGEVLGPVDCTALLELQPMARVVGDVCYQVLEIHAGAKMEGDLRHVASEGRPTLTLAASNDN